MTDDDQVLSQSEIDALLSAFEEGGEEPDSPVMDEPVSDQVVSFDLTSQDRIIRGRMPTLDMINDRAARYLRVSFSGLARMVISVMVESTSLMKFGEFINYLPLPSCLNIVSISPLRGSAVLAIDTSFLYAILNRMFGGSITARQSSIEGRDFTPIELMVIQKIVDLFLDELGKAWEPVASLRPEYQRTEVNPQFVAVVSPGDVVIKTTFEVELEEVRGRLHWVMPYSSVEPIKGKLHSGLQAMDSGAQASGSAIARILDRVEVELKAELGKTEMSIRDLMTLKAGQIISLDRSSDEPVLLKVEDVDKFVGEPLITGGNLAVKVTGALQAEE